jgi:hypothetical protein
METATRMAFTPRLTRIHSTGTSAEISEHADAWRIQINLREPNHSPMAIVTFMPSAERAKEVADKEIKKYGHVCTEACKDWIQTQ